MNHFLNVCRLLLTLLLAQVIQSSVVMVSLLNNKCWGSFEATFSQKAHCYTITMKTVWEQQKSCCKCLAAFHFVLWDIAFHFPFSSQNGLKQQWLLKGGVKELLAQKGFCWSSTAWPEHTLERGASFAMAGGTVSPTYSSLKSKLRGFVAPGNFCKYGNILFCWCFLPLLALRLQKPASLQSSNEEQELLQLASKWMFQPLSVSAQH